MEGVERNANRKKNIQMRRLIDDSNVREQPLEILEQEISIFEEPEHAQVHADARDQPNAPFMSIFGFANLPAEPEIHCRGGKQKGSKRRIPGAVKNVAGNNQQIFPRRPRSDAPVKRDDDHEENAERNRRGCDIRLRLHARRAKASRSIAAITRRASRSARESARKNTRAN